MPPAPESIIRLREPRVEANSVHFEWDVEPETSLYVETRFRLDFPATVDVASIPPAIWLRVMMICLHPTWTLLRPCRVVIPRRLPIGEREFWSRMTDAAVWTLEANDRAADPQTFWQRTERAIEIVESGEAVEPWPVAADGGVVTACFSGGRDSLTQLAMLEELGERPVLVTTTSASPGSADMQSRRRRTVIDEIVARRGVELVEVESDLRSCWDNANGLATRFGVCVTELTDTLLYLASAWVVGFARGASTVFQACEAEVQESVRQDGLIVQHRHFMYSLPTQLGIRALVAPTGMGISGLTSPLLQFQVQRLLSRRYSELRDLQYSCFSQRPGEDVCSRCESCLRIAANLMSDGVKPSEIGIDLNTLLQAQREWVKYDREADPGASPVSSRHHGEDHILRLLRANDAGAINRFLDGDATPETVEAFEQLRAYALAAAEPPPEPGYRFGYLDFVEPRLRHGLESIFAEYFEPEPEQNYAGVLERTRMLVDWISAPLLKDRAGTDQRAAAPRPERPRPPAAAEPAPEVLAEIAHLLPGPEPELTAPDGMRVLPVADTELTGNELAYLTEAVESNWISSTGPFVERLEREFARYCGVDHAVATASGATALELMLRAAGIGAGDEVIMPAFTMVATANAAHNAGAIPVFVDSDPATWNMDLDRVRQAIGPRTRAIMAMHTYGQPVDMDALAAIAEANSLALFEDAAEAHGATVRGRRVGSFGNAAAFSLYGNKIISSGEGGLLTTGDPELAAAARALRSHDFAEDRHFWHRRRANNFRMSNLQAAVGVAQLERIDEFLAARRRLASLYRERLGETEGVTLPPVQHDLDGADWVFGILLDENFPVSRDELRARLAAAGIETRTFFVPLHLQPAYLDSNPGRRLPVAERFGRDGLYLPLTPRLTESDVERVATEIAQAGAVASGSTASPNRE